MPPKQKQEPRQSDDKLIAIIAGAIAIGASAQVTATSLSPVLGIPVATLIAVLKMASLKTVSYGGTSVGGLPTAAAETVRVEPLYRAQYVLAASRRVQQAVKDGVPLDDAMETERRFFRQHLDAIMNRAKVAGKVDRMARRYGDLLGWYAKLDNRTSPECREANGKNFNASVRPPIGFPGSVHPHCRCQPGKPHPTKGSVYGVQPEKRAA